MEVGISKQYLHAEIRYIGDISQPPVSGDTRWRILRQNLMSFCVKKRVFES